MNKWYLDNDCSRHMTSDYSRLLGFTKVKNSGEVSFGDNLKGKIIEISNVCRNSSNFIENVCFVENLKHNLLSYRVIFYKSKCIIENACGRKILFARKNMHKCIHHLYRLCINFMINIF